MFFICLGPECAVPSCLRSTTCPSPGSRFRWLVLASSSYPHARASSPVPRSKPRPRCQSHPIQRGPERDGFCRRSAHDRRGGFRPRHALGEAVSEDDGPGSGPGTVSREGPAHPGARFRRHRVGVGQSVGRSGGHGRDPAPGVRGRAGRGTQPDPAGDCTSSVGSRLTSRLGGRTSDRAGGLDSCHRAQETPCLAQGA